MSSILWQITTNERLNIVYNLTWIYYSILLRCCFLHLLCFMSLKLAYCMYVMCANKTPFFFSFFDWLRSANANKQASKRTRVLYIRLKTKMCEKRERESRSKRRRIKDEAIIVHIHTLKDWSSGRYDVYIYIYSKDIYFVSYTIKTHVDWGHSDGMLIKNLLNNKWIFMK